MANPIGYMSLQRVRGSRVIFKLVSLVFLILSTLTDQRTNIVLAQSDWTTKLNPINILNVNKLSQIAQFGNGTLEGVAWSPDGRLLAFTSSIGVWIYPADDLAASGYLFESQTDDVLSIAFSRDSNIIAAGHRDGTIRLWDVVGKRVFSILNGHTSGVDRVGFSPDNKLLVSVGNETINIWNVTTSQTIKSIHYPSTILHSNYPTYVGFSPDGMLVVSGDGDGVIRLWDVSTGQNTATLEGHTGSISSIAFSPDGKSIASASLARTLLPSNNPVDNTVRLWDVASGQVKSILKGHTDSVSSIIFSPDNRFIVSGSLDKTIRVWDIASGQTTTVLQNDSEIKDIASDPSGNLIASVGFDNTAHVWDIANIRIKSSLTGHSESMFGLAFNWNSKLLAAGDRSGTIHIWDVEKLQEVSAIKGHKEDIERVKFISKGNMLVSASENATVHVWQLADMQLKVTVQEGNGILDMAVSPDGTKIATADIDGTVHLLAGDGSQKTLLFREKGFPQSISSISFSPDGKYLLFGEWAGRAILWDIANNEPQLVLNGFGDLVECVAFSPNGKQIAIGIQRGTVVLFDIASKQQLQVLKGQGLAESIAFSPDGTLLAEANSSNSIELWDVGSGQLKMVLKGHTAGVNYVAFSNDDKLLASTSWDGTVRLWGVQSAQ